MPRKGKLGPLSKRVCRESIAWRLFFLAEGLLGGGPGHGGLVVLFVVRVDVEVGAVLLLLAVLDGRQLVDARPTV